MCAQQSFLDSIRIAFNLEMDPARKIDLFYEIASDRALDNPTLGFAYADSIDIMARKAGYQKGLAMAKHLRGFAFDDLGEYEKALDLFQEELQIFIDINDRDEQSTALTNIGSAWNNMGRMDSAVTYFLKSMAIDEELGDSFGVSILHNNIGNIYSDDGIYDKAIAHFEKALSIRQQQGMEKRYAQCYSNLATTYGRMKEYAKAEEYGKKALEYALKFENLGLAGVIANSLGNNCNDQGKFREAITWLDQALGYWKEINHEAYQTYALYNLSNAYYGLGDGIKALRYAQEGYAIIQKLSLENQHELYYKAFAQAYEASGDISHAYEWYKKYIALADSIFKQDNARKVAQLELRFETQKKEAQLVRQQLELEKQASQKRMILIIAIAGLLTFAVAFQYFRIKQRSRQQQAELIAQLKQTETEKLREMDAIKSTFFANISHEFRTPLTLILSPVEQMMNNTFKGDYTKYYQIIHRNGKRLLNLVNQLLDLSKLESGKVKLQVSEGNLGSFVSAIAGSFESLAVRQQVGLHIKVSSDPIICYFDREKLEQILVNLISNAFKFTGEGGTVYVDAIVSDGKATITVEDTGIGIPQDQLQHLFERFTKSTMSEVQAGSGIGLALAKELAQLHGGNIDVTSKEGEGSKFSVTLEVGKAFFKADEISVSPVTSGGAENTHREYSLTSSKASKSLMSDVLSRPAQPTLLIAEDNRDVRAYIADTFAGLYEIIEAENGRIALEKALESTPDIIITDVMMPEMNGTELCRLLKSNEKTSHIPVVMLTARAEKSDKLEGLETGADDYLIKPFEAKELQVRVANLIEQRRRLQEHFRKSLTSFTPAPAEVESMDAQFLLRVRETVEANLENEDFSVVDLSKQIGMSRSQLHRKLSALTGFSPNEIIRNMRLERAKQLLELKVGTVSEISYRCGFNSPAYFIKCFREYFGTTPGEIT